MTKNPRWIVLITLALLLAVIYVGAAQEDTADDVVCPLGQGYWKTHTDAWPVNSLMLGSQFYTQDELIAILNLPTAGDASLTLAHQLIATKLNIASGADATSVAHIIVEADGLLVGFAGKLPYHVDPSSATGQNMVVAASTFEVFNAGTFTSPECIQPEVTPEVTPEITPEITPEVTPVVDNSPVIIVIEGPVKNININIITIYNFTIVLDENDPIINAIRIGDIVRVEGEIDDDRIIIVGGSINITIVAVSVTIVSVDVFINVDGQVYRDDSDCGNPPPPWAPAHGWHRRCESQGGDDDDD